MSIRTAKYLQKIPYCPHTSKAYLQKLLHSQQHQRSLSPALEKPLNLTSNLKFCIKEQNQYDIDDLKIYHTRPIVLRGCGSYLWIALFMFVNCRIKTGYSNLVSCFGPRIRMLARYFTSAFASVKYLSQRPHPRAKTWHKIWMTGLNPNYDTTPIHSLQNSQNKCQKSSFTYDHRRHLILPLPPVHALPTVNARTCC